MLLNVGNQTEHAKEADVIENIALCVKVFQIGKVKVCMRASSDNQRAESASLSLNNLPHFSEVRSVVHTNEKVSFESSNVDVVEESLLNQLRIDVMIDFESTQGSVFGGDVGFVVLGRSVLISTYASLSCTPRAFFPLSRSHSWGFGAT